MFFGIYKGLPYIIYGNHEEHIFYLAIKKAGSDEIYSSLPGLSSERVAKATLNLLF